MRWAEKLTGVNRRTLSPPFWTHVNPYGRFEMDMSNRLGLTLPQPRTGVPNAEPASQKSSGTNT
ncbi:hypothetical protein [Streptomyces vastus]|uniref:Tn3 transposase DDE domain-containing protein n=1 Tax=Streptomyces vastus TaxID=285451 RepID=A0ABN3QXN3_9ACTN